MLAELTVKELRAFFIRIAHEGGAPRDRVIKALLTSRSSYYEDAATPLPSLNTDR